MLFNETSQTPNPIFVIAFAVGFALLFVGLEYLRARLKLRAWKRHMTREFPALQDPEFQCRREEIKRYNDQHVDQLTAIDRAYDRQLRDAQDKWADDLTDCP